MLTVFCNVALFSCAPETIKENESTISVGSKNCCGDETDILSPPTP